MEGEQQIVSTLQCLQKQLPLAKIQNIHNITLPQLNNVRLLIQNILFTGSLAEQRDLFCYKLLFWHENSQIVFPSVDLMRFCGFNSVWGNLDGLNQNIVNICQYIDFTKFFISNFYQNYPQCGVEFHNLSYSGKFFKETFEKQHMQAIDQLFREKHIAQFFILDLNSRISENLIQLDYSKDLVELRDLTLELQQLVSITSKYLAYINQTSLKIDCFAIIQLLLENLTSVFLFPSEKHILQHSDITNCFLNISEAIMEIVYTASQMKQFSTIKMSMEIDTPRESQQEFFNCRKSVLVQILDSFTSILSSFDGEGYIQNILVMLSTNFALLVNQMNQTSWFNVSKQDKEIIKSLICSSCQKILSIINQNNKINYFVIISFLDLSLSLFTSKVVFLDKLFMQILINLITTSNQPGLIHKSVQIIQILFKQQCVIQFTRSYYKNQFQGEITCPQTVSDMIYALQAIIIV